MAFNRLKIDVSVVTELYASAFGQFTFSLALKVKRLFTIKPCLKPASFAIKMPIMYSETQDTGVSQVGTSVRKKCDVPAHGVCGGPLEAMSNEEYRWAITNTCAH